MLVRLGKPTRLLVKVVQPVTIRSLMPTDGAVAAEVFFDAVHHGAADVYTLEQRKAWAGDAPDPAAWMRVLMGKCVSRTGDLHNCVGLCEASGAFKPTSTHINRGKPYDDRFCISGPRGTDHRYGPRSG